MTSLAYRLDGTRPANDTPAPRVARARPWRALARLGVALLERRRDVRELRELDERLLRDVGLVRLRDHAGREVFARCDEPGRDA